MRDPPKWPLTVVDRMSANLMTQNSRLDWNALSWDHHAVLAIPEIKDLAVSLSKQPVTSNLITVDSPSYSP
jgi:hypothetical protein